MLDSKFVGDIFWPSNWSDIGKVCTFRNHRINYKISNSRTCPRTQHSSFCLHLHKVLNKIFHFQSVDLALYRPCYIVCKRKWADSEPPGYTQTSVHSHEVLFPSHIFIQVVGHECNLMFMKMKRSRKERRVRKNVNVPRWEDSGTKSKYYLLCARLSENLSDSNTTSLPICSSHPINMH